MGPESQKCETRQTPIATNTIAHPPTHAPTDPTTHRRTSQPTHNVLQQYSNTAADAYRTLYRKLGFPLFTDFPLFRGARDPAAGGPFNTPRLPSRPWALFLRRGHQGLLCGAGVARTRGRGRPSGGRESQRCFWHVITKIFSKIHLDMTTTTTTTTEERDITRIFFGHDT